FTREVRSCACRAARRSGYQVHLVSESPNPDVNRQQVGRALPAGSSSGHAQIWNGAAGGAALQARDASTIVIPAKAGIHFDLALQRIHVPTPLLSESPVSSPASRPLAVRRLGRQPYAPVWQAMRAFTDTRGADTGDELWLLEHD